MLADDESGDPMLRTPSTFRFVSKITLQRILTWSRRLSASESTTIVVSRMRLAITPSDAWDAACLVSHGAALT